MVLFPSPKLAKVSSGAQSDFKIFFQITGMHLIKQICLKNKKKM